MVEKKRINIAFCIPCMVIGGVETVFANTIDELSKNQNLNIQIITHAKIREKLYIDWLKMHPEISVHVYYPLCNWFEDVAPKCRSVLKPIRKMIFGLYKKYRRLIWHNKFKNVDLFIDYKNFEFFKELRHVNVPVIGWAHSALSYFKSNDFDLRLPIYDKIIGLTDDFTNDFKEKYPKCADKIIRVYNPVNMDVIRQQSESEKAPHGKYFCHVSRLVPGKDIKTLLNAFDLFAQKHKDIKLYIVGDGPQARQFQSYAKTLRSGSRVIFTGAKNNPYAIMKGAIANILSSEYEGFGMVLIESMALSRPVISSNYKSGAAEILGQGKFGLLFEVGNAKQLCECMEKIYTDKDLSKRLVKDAYKSLKRFDLSKISEQITDFIYKVKEG